MSSRQETRQKVFDRKLKECYEHLNNMSDKAGFVYVAVHDVWPNYCKIGCTKDPVQRIKTYSTYDPVDCYKLVAYKLVDNMREYENYIHSFLKDFRLNSEWFNIKWTTATGIIHAACNEDRLFILQKSLSTCKIKDYTPLKILPCKNKMNTLTRHSHNTSYSMSPSA